MRQLLMFGRPAPLFPAWVGEIGLLVALASSIALLFTFYMRWRNHRVRSLRVAMIGVVMAASQLDAQLGRDYAWRMEMLDSVSYDDMMRKFWRPVRLDAFYPDPSFLMPPIDG